MTNRPNPPIITSKQTASDFFYWLYEHGTDVEGIQGWTVARSTDGTGRPVDFYSSCHHYPDVDWLFSERRAINDWTRGYIAKQAKRKNNQVWFIVEPEQKQPEDADEQDAFYHSLHEPTPVLGDWILSDLGPSIVIDNSPAVYDPTLDDREPSFEDLAAIERQDDLVQQILALQAQVERLQGSNAALTGRVAELERQVRVQSEELAEYHKQPDISSIDLEPMTDYDGPFDVEYGTRPGARF